jgi:hypothetical protein
VTTGSGHAPSNSKVAILSRGEAIAANTAVSLGNRTPIPLLPRSCGVTPTEQIMTTACLDPAKH